MIETILPASVRASETFEDLLEEPLFPEELAVVASAVQKRRREFTSARACARIALAALGMERPPLVPGPRGAPSWPPAVVGSMTHCCGYRAAAVARQQDVIALGIDAEPHERLPPGVLETIATPRDREQLLALEAGDGSVCWDRLLFSAKESVYKAWFPLTGRWLGFEEANLVIRPSDRTFTATFLVSPPLVQRRVLTGFTGTWRTTEHLIATAVVLPNT